MKEKIFNAFRIVVLAFILSSAIGYSLADWTPPSGTPPFNNVPPPINVGPTTQVKDGNLFVKRFWAQKAQSLSTVAADTDDTLVTKDYVDGIKAGLGVWKNVPLTDTAPFDIDCDYRVDLLDGIWPAGRYDVSYKTPTRVGIFSGSIVGILNTNKSAGVSSSDTFGFTVTKMESRCPS